MGMYGSVSGRIEREGGQRACCFLGILTIQTCYRSSVGACFIDYEKVLCFRGTEFQDALDFGISNEVNKGFHCNWNPIMHTSPVF